MQEESDSESEDSEDENEEPCCICQEPKSGKPNLIVLCDGEECYGISVVPSGDWFCQRCKSKTPVESTKAICCSSKEGAFYKTTTPNEYIHVICTIWNPEIDYKEDSGPISVPTSALDAKECYICGKKVGLTLHCNYQDCPRYFHATCAIDRSVIDAAPPKIAIKNRLKLACEVHRGKVSSRSTSPPNPMPSIKRKRPPQSIALSSDEDEDETESVQPGSSASADAKAKPTSDYVEVEEESGIVVTPKSNDERSVAGDAGAKPRPVPGESMRPGSSNLPNGTGGGAGVNGSNGNNGNSGNNGNGNGGNGGSRNPSSSNNNNSSSSSGIVKPTFPISEKHRDAPVAPKKNGPPNPGDLYVASRSYSPKDDRADGTPSKKLKPNPSGPSMVTSPSIKREFPAIKTGDPVPRRAPGSSLTTNSNRSSSPALPDTPLEYLAKLAADYQSKADEICGEIRLAISQYNQKLAKGGSSVSQRPSQGRDAELLSLLDSGFDQMDNQKKENELKSLQQRVLQLESTLKSQTAAFTSQSVALSSLRTNLVRLLSSLDLPNGPPRDETKVDRYVAEMADICGQLVALDPTGFKSITDRILDVDKNGWR
ncbi:PHD-zinc-finger like domain-containing protein [Polychytrium aggregatum]|uniref:PHD-zinc-finger like domain-containing protein n=1 Tax=Polychytrium aggregatum TaxID=110093 RepID=UPI0022FEDDBB|nr:PHD-zinc-finger like domain-containing protein [Polychytrium aggregatum]KAI9208952.1 PHD-zinc-finger like domain-containing protein [Polychytrium aggregatum]